MALKFISYAIEHNPNIMFYVHKHLWLTIVGDKTAAYELGVEIRSKFISPSEIELLLNWGISSA